MKFMIDSIVSTISFNTKNEELTSIYFKSLILESRSSANNRVTVDLQKENNEIMVKFIAKDFTALRAAMNSYLRWFKLITEIVNF
ncbi:MAG: hypothetical protein EAX96_18225 [Candidatus Lokiarchaeota archaeon]|nr:hypothetical protein [Candidatus Lokiarchaeota archaeon]